MKEVIMQVEPPNIIQVIIDIVTNYKAAGYLIEA